MSNRTLYVQPTKNMGLLGTVTAAGVDADYLAAWAVDGRPGFPIFFDSTGATITITNTAKTVNCVAICHHNLDAGLVVTISGGVSGSITIPALPSNGVPLNAWTTISSPASTGSVTLTFSGNSQNAVIGEIVIGEALVLERRLKLDSHQFGVRRYWNAPSGNELSGIPPYSERARSRVFTGSQIFTASGLTAILDAFDSQDGYAYPMPILLIQNDSDTTDARLVTLAEPQYAQVSPEDGPLYAVDLSFTEYPRTRW